jgi:phosphatidylethanolamine-binding protein (PEBP) family uncharacterized protein
MQLNEFRFHSRGAIPTRYTCEGDNVSSPFTWRERPRETKSFALIVHDQTHRNGCGQAPV